MKQQIILIFGLTLLLLTACNLPAPQQTVEKPAPIFATANPDPISSATAISAKTPTPLSEPTHTLSPPTPTPTPTASLGAIPPPALFDTRWNDRSPFEAGLIDTEESILTQLNGASIYHIELTIAPDMTHLQGREEVYYTNREDTPLSKIYFRLFPNLLDGSSTVSNLKVNSHPVEPRYSLADSTIEVPLSSPLPPGESVVVSMDFAVEIPTEAGATYGALSYLDNILALPHIYPMIVVYDDEGWNVEIPPTYGDVVYSETSFYLVRVTAPADQIIVGSGVIIKTEATEATQSITFAAGPMRDFYLAGSNDYTVVSQSVGNTVINSYAPTDVSESALIALGYAVDALNGYNHHFGPYPFTELDLIATPTLAGGIEYPGIIVVALSLYQNPGPFFEIATVHEVGHQWFYSAVGSDQVDDPWLDESLTQYAVWTYFRDMYGEQGDAGFKRSMEGLWGNASETGIPIGLPVTAYTDSDYGAIVYGRGPLFFDALAQTMGQDVFDAFLRDYYQTFHWHIATPDTLKQLAEKHCNCDLTPLFEEWVYGG